MENTFAYILLLEFFLSWKTIQAELAYGDLKCNVDQSEMLSMEECRINAVNRTRNVINIRLKLRKMLTELQVNLKLFKREQDGWHPYLYKMTLDVCLFLQHPRRFLVPNEIFKHIRHYTNLNHTCPYKANSELQVSNLLLDENIIINLYPVDPGEYALNTIWYYKQKSLFQINGSVIYTL